MVFEEVYIPIYPRRYAYGPYSHAKVQDQRSVDSEDRLETNAQTDGQTNGGDCITSVANVVGDDQQNRDLYLKL